MLPLAEVPAAGAPSRYPLRWLRHSGAPGGPGRRAHRPRPEWADLNLVFAQPNGKAIERKSDWHAWKVLLREAGVRDVRLHDGRHTAATLLLSEGAPTGRHGGAVGHARCARPRTPTPT